jgi:hypothetical protein
MADRDAIGIDGLEVVIADENATEESTAVKDR